jgi:hypothetical protein
MIYHYKKGTPSIVGGIGDGSKADPWYWYGKTSGQTVAVNNSNADSSDNYRLYFRVMLKGGTEYHIGQTAPGGGDGRIKLYDSNFSEIRDDDDGGFTIAGVGCSDAVTFTPDSDGIYYIGAGAYSSSTGDYTVAIDPLPEQEPLPEIKWLHPTSSGFNKAGKAVGYRSASLAGCAIVRIPTDGMVFYASLSEAKTTAETGQALTASGNVTYSTVDGIPCAVFDGSSHYTASGAALPIGNSKRTMSAWVKAANYSSQKSAFGYGVMSDNQVCSLDYLNGNTLRFCGWYADTDFEIGSSGTLWHHVALVYDGTNDLIYWDGVLVKTQAQYRNTPSTDLTIGGFYSNWQGNVAALRIYNRVLSGDEIQQLAGEFDV